MSQKNKILWKLHRSFREATASIRVHPNFFIIGTPVCAKTLLYRYVIQHPLILENLRNETSYFDINYKFGFGWYKSNFPTVISKNLIKIIKGKTPLVGETINIGSPLVAKRISKMFSNPSVILILRNPIDRAYAKYLQEVKAKNETYSFEKALELEQEKIHNNRNKISKDTILNRHNRLWYTYQQMGIYIEFLERWNKFFPKNKMLVIKAEDLFENPLSVVNSVFSFLNLYHLRKLNDAGKNQEKNTPSMNLETRKRLNRFFKPFNERLYEFLGTDFNWN